jgi:Mor family transcriptional regulator
MQEIVRELCDAIGFVDTIAIIRRWGGRHLYVPHMVGRTHALALALGYDTANKLANSFGGCTLKLPAERNALLDARNAAIVEAHKSGEIQESIGLRFGLTRQGVSAVLKKAASNS